MEILQIKVPERLIFEETMKFSNQLKNLDAAKKYIFNFSSTFHIDPFSLLYLSSEIERCRRKHKNSEFIATKFQHLKYMAHMGFFKAFGLNYGKLPGEAKGSSTYIPIKIFDCLKIWKDSKEMKIDFGELMEHEAKNISKVLTQSDNGNLYDTLVYSIREILRNVLEHSQSSQFGFCAQYRPSEHRVSVAILDRGIGISKALSNNPNININSDEEALLYSIKPGISGKSFKGQKRKQTGIWANSGFGLYMTSNICKMGGSFFIASGSKGLYMSQNKHRFLNIPINGTAVNLRLNTSNIGDLDNLLSELRDKAETSQKASKSSMGLSKLIK